MIRCSRDRISLTAHDAPVGLKKLKLWDEISDREWLRYLTVEPLNTESLVLTSWGLSQYLKGLLQSLRFLTKLNVYKTISVFLLRYPLVTEELQGDRRVTGCA